MEDKIQEILDRSKRVETRLTKYLESQGFNTHGHRPTWSTIEGIGRLDIPAMGCSISDCMATIPPEYPKDAEVLVYHNGKFVMSVMLD